MKFSTQPHHTSSFFALARMARQSNASPPTRQRLKHAAQSLNTLQVLGLGVVGAMLVAYLWARSVDVRQGLGLGRAESCAAKEPHPKVKIVSVDPFIAHITDFVSESEREYFMGVG